MRARLCVVAVSALLAACGGGGSSPVTSPTPGPSFTSGATATPGPTATPIASATPAPVPTATPVASATPSAVATAAAITHVVFIIQENRTPDNLFHGLPGADIANSGVDTNGDTIQLSPVDLVTNWDLDHSHNGFLSIWNDGKMNGGNHVAVGCGHANQPACPDANPQYSYVPQNEVQEYFTLAEQYAFADRMFQTNQGPSFPAHQFLFGGTSAPTATSPLFASENPIDKTTGVNGEAGCSAPSTSQVAMIDPQSNITYQAPCFEHPTLSDELEAAGLTWRYYAVGDQSIWNAPDAIAHIRDTADYANDVVPQSQVLTDITAGKLANVTWITPDGAESDHAGITDGSGPSWVAAIVNEIGQSSYWNSTAIFIVWDDWGGWFDHVAPSNIYNSYELGLRVPLIVVSPYAKSGYVSHVNHQFGSLLHFAEERYNLPSLGFADAVSDDLSDCFDFTQKPRPFSVVHARIPASYFMHSHGPPTAPDDM